MNFSKSPKMQKIVKTPDFLVPQGKMQKKCQKKTRSRIFLPRPASSPHCANTSSAT